MDRLPRVERYVDHSILVHIDELQQRHRIRLVLHVSHLRLNQAELLNAIVKLLRVNLEIWLAFLIHLRQENIWHAVTIQINIRVRVRLRDEIAVGLQALRVLLRSQDEI